MVVERLRHSPVASLQSVCQALGVRHVKRRAPRTSWRRPTGGRLSRLLLRIRRIWIQKIALRAQLARPNEITVVIGVRDRADYRLANTLRSIRAQRYPHELVQVVVVDYGSGCENARRAERLCAAHGAEYLRVDGVSVWSASRCLNIAIRRADTKFVMRCDADILLPPNFLSDAVAVLTMSPASVVCSAMLDLPEESAETLEHIARTKEDLKFEPLRQLCTLRNGWLRHPAVCVTYAALFRAIRGYDEHYEGWGTEDKDLMKRFVHLGLKLRPLAARSFYMHQWHPESMRDKLRREGNQSYYANTRSILRNDDQWGLPATGQSIGTPPSRPARDPSHADRVNDLWGVARKARRRTERVVGD